MENKDRNEVFDSPARTVHAPTCRNVWSGSNYVDHGIHPSFPTTLLLPRAAPRALRTMAFRRIIRCGSTTSFVRCRSIGKVSKSYEEAMPDNCSLQSTDRYAVKHNPAAYFVDGDDRTACERDNVSFDQFAPDLAN